MEVTWTFFNKWMCVCVCVGGCVGVCVCLCFHCSQFSFICPGYFLISVSLGQQPFNHLTLIRNYFHKAKDACACVPTPTPVPHLLTISLETHIQLFSYAKATKVWDFLGGGKKEKFLNKEWSYVAVHTEGHRSVKHRAGKVLPFQRHCPGLPTGSAGSVLCSEGLAGGGETMSPLALPWDTRIGRFLGFPCGTQGSDKWKINWELLKTFYSRSLHCLFCKAFNWDKYSLKKKSSSESEAAGYEEGVARAQL